MAKQSTAKMWLECGKKICRPGWSPESYLYLKGRVIHNNLGKKVDFSCIYSWNNTDWEIWVEPEEEFRLNDYQVEINYGNCRMISGVWVETKKVNSY